jgi:hypothetical protein
VAGPPDRGAAHRSIARTTPATSGRPTGRADYTVWGWVHLMVGVLAALIGVGLLTGNMVARGAAVGLASFSALASLTVVAATPAWSVIIIAVDVLVIFAIVVHGGELGRASRPG